MASQEWINYIIYLQARCRGYLIRRELKCVHAEFEDIVCELDGSVEHLSWRGTLLPKPHFTDTDSATAFFRYPQPKIQPQDIQPQDIQPQDIQLQDIQPQDIQPQDIQPQDIQPQEIPASVQEVKVQNETPHLHSKVLVPERDKERDCSDTNTPAGGDSECDRVQRDCTVETVSENVQMSDSMLQHAAPMHTLLKDVAHTPEALKQHRNALAMELLWIQQAIASRKKYLSLKQKMETW